MLASEAPTQLIYFSLIRPNVSEGEEERNIIKREEEEAQAPIRPALFIYSLRPTETN